MNNFVQSVEGEPGKVAADADRRGQVVSGGKHRPLIEWDRFLLDERLDQLKSGQTVSPASVNAEELKAGAARRAREEVLAVFHHSRTRLLQRLESVPGDAPFSTEPNRLSERVG